MTARKIARRIQGVEMGEHMAANEAGEEAL